MNKQHQWSIWYFVGAFFLLMLFQSVWTTWRTVELIPYSQFLTLLNERKIVEATVHQEQIKLRVLLVAKDERVLIGLKSVE